MQDLLRQPVSVSALPYSPEFYPPDRYLLHHGWRENQCRAVALARVARKRHPLSGARLETELPCSAHLASRKSAAAANLHGRSQQRGSIPLESAARPTRGPSQDLDQRDRRSPGTL